CAAIGARPPEREDHVLDGVGGVAVQLSLVVERDPDLAQAFERLAVSAFDWPPFVADVRELVPRGKFVILELHRALTFSCWDRAPGAVTGGGLRARQASDRGATSARAR